MFTFLRQLKTETQKIKKQENVSEKLAQHMAYVKAKSIQEPDGTFSLDARALYVTEMLPDFIKYVQAKKFAHIDFTFNDSAFELLPALLPLNQFRSLSLFNLTNNDPEEKLIDSAMTALQKNTTLKNISFPCISSAANMAKITAGVKGNLSLTSVSFALPHDDLQGRKEAAKLISKNVINGNSRIERLRLDTLNEFDAETLEIIIRALATNTTLKKLHINVQAQKSEIEELKDNLVCLLVDVTNARKRPVELSLCYDLKISKKGLEMLQASEYIGHISTSVCGLDAIHTKGGYRLEKEAKEKELKDAVAPKTSAHHATTFGASTLVPITVVTAEPNKQLVL